MTVKDLVELDAVPRDKDYTYKPYYRYKIFYEGIAENP